MVIAAILIFSQSQQRDRALRHRLYCLAVLGGKRCGLGFLAALLRLFYLCRTGISSAHRLAFSCAGKPRLREQGSRFWCRGVLAVAMLVSPAGCLKPQTLVAANEPMPGETRRPGEQQRTGSTGATPPTVTVCRADQD